MGQKTHPTGFRIGIIKTWSSRWYEEKNYAKWLHEDLKLKGFIKKKLNHAGVAYIEIERAAGIISKAIKSAAANAEDRSGGEASIDQLRIHTIAVDGGTIAKRWMPRSMGRANRINHRTSHLTVVVTDE